MAQTFGVRLMTFRKAQDMSQVRLAKAAHTTQRAISYYETGLGFPPAPLVARLAHALKISSDELLGINHNHARLLISRRSTATPRAGDCGRSFNRWRSCRRRISEP